VFKTPAVMYSPFACSLSCRICTPIGAFLLYIIFFKPKWFEEFDLKMIGGGWQACVLAKY
jgi:hypothetical protein